MRFVTTFQKMRVLRLVANIIFSDLLDDILFKLPISKLLGNCCKVFKFVAKEARSGLTIDFLGLGIFGISFTILSNLRFKLRSFKGFVTKFWRLASDPFEIKNRHLKLSYMVCHPIFSFIPSACKAWDLLLRFDTQYSNLFVFRLFVSFTITSIFWSGLRPFKGVCHSTSRFSF